MPSPHDIPIVQGLDPNSANCQKTLNRLKDGPEDISKILGTGHKYIDDTFYGVDSLYTPGITLPHLEKALRTELHHKLISFKRFSATKEYKDYKLFWGDHEKPRFHEIDQGEVGNCYFVASVAGASEHPEIIKSMFVNQEVNEEGIYLVRFFIRGKPWVVSIDDNIVFKKRYEKEYMKYARPSDHSMWAPLLEKAMAKVKGTFSQTERGFITSGLNSITGAPIEIYGLNRRSVSDISKLFLQMKEMDKQGYLMNAATVGTNHDTLNSCNIANGHAYTVTSVFSMIESNGKKHDMILLRNPWGHANYNQEWSSSDKRWTDELVKNVPYGVDPRKTKEHGFFTIPKEKLIQGKCIQYISWAYMRDDEGYENSWYDYENGKDGTYQHYYVKPTTNKDDIYLTLEGYMNEIIPASCKKAK